MPERKIENAALNHCIVFSLLRNVSGCLSSRCLGWIAAEEPVGLQTITSQDLILPQLPHKANAVHARESSR
jgi:hypothetical protein